MQDKTALFIGAHNDDCEFAAGGLACQLSRLGFRVVFVNISCKRRHDSEKARRIFEDPKLVEDFDRQDIYAAEILGAEKIIIGKKDNSFFEANWSNIIPVKSVVEKINPDIAFIMFPYDNHIEHYEVSRASIKCLRSTSCEIHSYEVGPMQTMVYFYPDFFVDISEDMDRIKKSLMVFDQPSAQGKHLWNEKKVAAGFRGHMAGAGFIYAEAYKIIRFPEKYNELLLPRLLKHKYKWSGYGQYPWGMQYYNRGGI